MIARKRSKPRRVSVARNDDYKAFLREHGVCDACYFEVDYDWRLVEPAHGPVNGLSSKGSDLDAIPLCRAHHREQHAMGWEAFCTKYNLNHAELVSYWNLAFEKEMNT